MSAAQPCGNIHPLGITGTPVIDEHSSALYLDAMVNRDGGPRHLVFGRSVADGVVLPGWPVDMADSLRAAGMSFIPRAQNQRGALTVIGDRLYVPYSGYYGGGCGGEYHGWVVGLRLDQPAAFGAWRTSTSGGGIWAPGGIAYDGRYLFAATGFKFGDSDWGGQEAVIRLLPDLRLQPTPQEFFAPSDWSETTVLGGVNPLPIDLPDGGPGTALLLALGNGKAYLLDRADLGGIGHPLAEQRSVTADMSSRLPPIARGTTCWWRSESAARFAPAKCKMTVWWRCAFRAGRNRRCIRSGAPSWTDRGPNRHHERRCG